MKSLKIVAALSIPVLALAACGGETATDTADSTEVVADESAPATGSVAAEAEGSRTIPALAQSNPELSTLVTAVTAAGLGETLSGAGPFTVLAPSNAAFGKVDKAALDGLLKPEAKTQLGNVLKYHVISGNIKSGDLANQIAAGNGTATVKTLGGGSLKVAMEGDKVTFTDAKGGKAVVTAPDMVASNGTVHVIDGVLMP
jgi:uncharacterized surface protein with fasciclin (FAS1) repeats